MAKRPSRALAKKPPGHELLEIFAALGSGNYRVVIDVTRVRRKKGHDAPELVWSGAKDIKIRRRRQATELVAGDVELLPPKRRKPRPILAAVDPPKRRRRLPPIVP